MAFSSPAYVQYRRPDEYMHIVPSCTRWIKIYFTHTLRNRSVWHLSSVVCNQQRTACYRNEQLWRNTTLMATERGNFYIWSGDESGFIGGGSLKNNVCVSFQIHVICMLLIRIIRLFFYISYLVLFCLCQEPINQFCWWMFPQITMPKVFIATSNEFHIHIQWEQLDKIFFCFL